MNNRASNGNAPFDRSAFLEDYLRSDPANQPDTSHVASSSSKTRVNEKIDTHDDYRELFGKSYWELVMHPLDGSLLDRFSQDDFAMEEWAKTKGLDELIAGIAAPKVSLPLFALNRLVLSHKDAIHVSTKLYDSLSGMSEYQLISVLTNQKINDKKDFFDLMKTVISYHPHVLGKIRKAVAGTRFASLLKL